MPQVAAAVAALDPAPAARGRRVGMNVDGQEHEIGPDDVQIVLQPLEGYQVERAGTHAVALNLELDDELRREGLAREVVHAVQAARKNAGLNVEDRIALTLGGDEELLDAARAHEEYVAGRDAGDVESPTTARGRRRGCRDRGPAAADLRRAQVGWRADAPTARLRGPPSRFRSWAWWWSR